LAHCKGQIKKVAKYPTNRILLTY